MNLGVIYIQSVLVIFAAGLVLGAIVTLAFLRFRRKRASWSSTLFGAWVIGAPLGCIGLLCCHHALFREWHRLQNEAVPAANCLTYEPSLTRLNASYLMPPPAFAAWVAAHPWGLAPLEPDESSLHHDGPRLGLTSCDAAYESPPGPAGNQLRVYYRAGVAYLTYNVL